MHAIEQKQLVGIVGAGAMGSGIAQVAAAAGHGVRLFDVRPDAATSAIDSIGLVLSKLAGKKKISENAAASLLSRIAPANELQELSGCGLIVEAIVEDLGTKKQLFRDLEAIADSDCILATNTSSLSITAVAAGLKRPERVVGMHFFNPAPVMELVEVVSGLETGRDCAERVYATARAWGKTPVHVKSTPGFIVNRVARPFYGQALKLLSEGAASPASIDTVLRECGGFRMGPFELMDLIGQDVNFAVTKSVWEAFFFNPRFEPSLLQQELVEAGRLGRKSGRGFYEYSGGQKTGEPAFEPSAPPPSVALMYGSNPFSKALEQRLAATGIRVEHGAPNSFYEGEMQPVISGGATLAITTGITATQLARAAETPHLVLVDYALDYASTKTVAVAKAATCGNAEYAAAVGLLQAAGYSVVAMRDLPGMMVLRTMAMLAGEAAEAVNTGVCTVEALNVAMRKGVNYPIGPLEWADHYGVGKVWTALHHISRSSSLLEELNTSGRNFRDYVSFSETGARRGE